MFLPKGLALQIPLLFSLFTFHPPVKQFSERSAASRTIYDFSATDIDGRNVSMSKYRGRVLVVVNVASQCGLTDRDYTQLADLHRRLSARGLSVAAFPSNQFAGQEPWPEPRIKQHALASWSVGFDLFAKVDVNGAGAHPLFAFLKSRLPGTFGNFLKWNFTKFLIDRSGRPVKRYGPNVQPLDMEADIAALLQEEA